MLGVLGEGCQESSCHFHYKGTRTEDVLNPNTGHGVASTASEALCSVEKHLEFFTSMSEHLIRSGLAAFFSFGLVLKMIYIYIYI